MRSVLSMLILILATLACTLTSTDEAENNVPTVVRTSQVVGQNPTQTSTGGSTTIPTRNPTAISTLGATPNTCVPRTDWPTITVQQGETLFSIAQRVNSTVTALQQANCLSSPDAITAGQQLRVPSVIPPTATLACQNQWFFQFRADRQPFACPTPVDTTDAAGHNFEGGRVYWYRATPAYPQNLIYVIYNDGTWTTYEDTWSPGQPESDPGIVPPPNFFQPVRGIGKVWREQPGVRQKLGWAYEPEYAFPGRRQGLQPPVNLTYEEYYIDHGTRGIVLQLRKGASGEQTWRVAGNY